MRISIISHSEDLDGLISAALLLKFLGERDKADVNISLCNHEQVCNVLKENLEENFDQIYILDLPFVYLSMIEKNNNVKKIYYYDHHLIPNETQIRLEKICSVVFLDEYYCTSEIIVKQYDEVISSYEQKLVLLAKTMDFMLENEVSDLCITLAKIIGMLNKDQLVELVYDLMDEAVFDSENKLFSKYQIYKDIVENREKKMILKIAKYMKIIKVRKIKVAVTLIDEEKINYKYIYAYMYKKNSDKNVKLYILFDIKTGHVLVSKTKRCKENYFIENYCMEKGGSGRQDAGGFKMKKFVGQNNYIEVTRILVEEIMERKKQLEKED